MATRKALGRRSEAESVRTRTRIIRAARRQFGARGFDAVALRDIASAAGTTHALVRHHFGSKDGVWRAVVEAAETDFGSALTPVLTGSSFSDDAVADAVRFLHRFVAVSARHPDLIRLVMHEGASSGARLTHLLRYLGGGAEALKPMVSRLHARGLLRQFDARSLFRFLLFAGGAPFAMRPLSVRLARSPLAAKQHAHLLVQTLLGEHSAPVPGPIRPSRGSSV